MSRPTVWLMAVCLLAAPGGEALAQSGRERTYYAWVTAGRQSGTSEFADERTFTVYDEPGRLIFSGSAGSPAFFDIALGRRITGRWTGGLAFHRGSKDGSGILVMGVPHPLFFGRARDRSEAVGGLTRVEHATHLQIGYLWDLTDKVQLHVLGGPSVFRVKQTVVTDAAFAEVGPPFTAITVTYTLGSRAKHSLGGHAGADVSYLVYEGDRYALRGGVMLRVAGASTDLPILDSEVATGPGGFQWGIGVRVAF